MAAFEAVSNILCPTISKLDIVDVRTAVLPEKRPPQTGFNPRCHRSPKNVISPWMAYLNMLRVSFGAGLLGMPMSISQAGLVLGPVMTFLTGLLIIHTNLTLLWCLNEIARQMRVPHISYRYGFRMAMLHGPPFLKSIGHHGPEIIALSMVASQIGICTVFVIFASDNLRDLADWPNSRNALIYMYIPFVCLELLMKNLKIVSFVAMTGNVFSAVGLVMVTIEIIRDGRGGDEHHGIVYCADLLLPLLLSFGTAVFNQSSMGVLLSCEKSLPDPKIMTKLVWVGITIPTFVSCIFGALGYWSFDVMEENILRYLNYHNTSTQILFALYLIIVTTTYPLQCYPAIQILLEVFKNHDFQVMPDDKTLKFVEYITRPLFVTITFIIAYTLPYQGPFIAFVGNFCTLLVSIIFPCLMEISLLYPNDFGPYHYKLIKNLIIVFFSIIAWIMGACFCAFLIYTRKITPEIEN